jgi:kinetochor protein Mis14/NSL1
MSKVNNLTQANQYIKTILLTSSENMTVNGIPANEGTLLESILDNSAYTNTTIEEHEPFDNKTFQKAKDLHAQEEELIEEIARMRREIPPKIVERSRNVYRDLDREDEAGLGLKTESSVKIASEEGPYRLPELERQSEFEGGWKKGIDGLERMMATLPGDVAKKERADKVEGYVRDMGRK